MANIPAHIMREAKSRDFRPSVRIGKSGLSETVLDEIRQQLRSRSLVKIKVNKGLFEREQRSAVWSQIAEQTQSTLVLQRGNIPAAARAHLHRRPVGGGSTVALCLGRRAHGHVEGGRGARGRMHHRPQAERAHALHRPRPRGA